MHLTSTVLERSKMEYPDKKSAGNGYSKVDYSPRQSSSLPQYGEQEVSRGTWTSRIVDSFRRDPHSSLAPKSSVPTESKVFDVESAAANTANSPLVRRLKGRHLQMIAIGGSIGTTMPPAPTGHRVKRN